MAGCQTFGSGTKTHPPSPQASSKMSHLTPERSRAERKPTVLTMTYR
jgi:hypothetical protein